jgi:hypothetical protein
MSTLSANPLAKHFRQPAVYIKLPSNGKWYPEGTLDLPVTGEVPIYAMTARDELTMKTPDALMNGASTIGVIESCCPAIKNAWKMPTIDLDAVLIAIRLATFGKEMEFSATCPHCGTEHDHALDLSYMLGKIQPADWSKPVSVNDLEIILKPQLYEEYNKNNMLNFEEQRLIQTVQNADLSEDEKKEQFGVLFQKLIETGISQISKSIAGIKLPDGSFVDNKEYIVEFLDNSEKAVWEAIKARLEAIREETTYNNVTLTCSNVECNKQFVAPFVFEQTNFFD